MVTEKRPFDKTLSVDTVSALSSDPASRCVFPSADTSCAITGLCTLKRVHSMAIQQIQTATLFFIVCLLIEE